MPWTKSFADVEKLAGLQRRLLDHAFGWSKPGGTIVFSNCSLDPLEGEEMVRKFLKENPAFGLDPIKAGESSWQRWFIQPEGWLRTTPADMEMGDPALSGMDGFFAARLRGPGLTHCAFCLRSAPVNHLRTAINVRTSSEVGHVAGQRAFDWRDQCLMVELDLSC